MIIEKEKKQRVEEWLGTGTVTAIAECFLRWKRTFECFESIKALKASFSSLAFPFFNFLFLFIFLSWETR